MPAKTVVSGGLGRMGLRISKLVKESSVLELSGVLERDGIPNTTKEYLEAPVSSSLELIAGKDMIIDFSSPENSIRVAEAAAREKAALVIGTTGFSSRQMEKLGCAAEDIPLLLAPNMSLGVNLLKKIARMITDALPGFDKEIIEAHHNRKADAPSGTALLFAEAIKNKGDRFVFGREGAPGPREAREIGIHAVRGGSITGEHTVMWIGDHERIEIAHSAETRDIFASGAIRAAEWLIDKPSGRIYTMEDVLF